MPEDLRQLGTPVETKEGAQSKADTAQSNAESYTDAEISDHADETEGVHGSSTGDPLETESGAQSKADTAQDNAESYADDQVADHETTGEHSQIDGDVVDRVEPIESLSGNIYVTEEGASDPTQNDGDLWFEYEVTE